jgi:hypothetical protein
MRVLQMVADGDPGGGAIHVLQILRGMSGRCSLGLITQEHSYLLDKAWALGMPCAGVNFFRSRLDARVPLKLRRLVWQFQPQVVHVHGGAGFLLAAAVTGVPTV